MKTILLVLAHPYRKSFNHAIAETVLKTLRLKRIRVFFHDLYKEKFDSALKASELRPRVKPAGVIKRYAHELVLADGIVIVHPNWWGQPPAILKGWVDRVMREGVAYQFQAGDNGEGVPDGLLKGKKAIIFNTSNTPAEREANVFGDPLEIIWKQCIFGFCGIQDVYRKTFSVVAASTPEERKRWLEEVRKVVGSRF
jgi:putative NADPH-quinone reductase